MIRWLLIGSYLVSTPMRTYITCLLIWRPSNDKNHLVDDSVRRGLTIRARARFVTSPAAIHWRRVADVQRRLLRSPVQFPCSDQPVQHYLPDTGLGFPDP